MREPCRCTVRRRRRRRRRAASREPEPRACCNSPGATARSGHGSTPRNARPRTISTKPAISSCDRWSTVLPTAAAAAPSSDEDEREPDDERHAREHDLPREPSLAESVDLDRGERREVAGDERQHARRHHRDQTCEKRDRELLKHRTAPSSSSMSSLASSGASSADGAPGPRAGVRDQYQAAAPSDHAAPIRMPPIGKHPREEVESVLRRCREDARAEVRDHLVEDLRSRPALGDPPADLGLHLLATGAFDWSSVSWQTGQTSFVSIAAALGRPRRAPARPGRAPAPRDASDSHDLQRALDAGVSSSASVTGPSTCSTIRPRRSTKNVCGVRGDVPRGRRSTPSVEHHRVRGAVRRTNVLCRTRSVRRACRSPTTTTPRDDHAVRRTRRGAASPACTGRSPTTRS